MHPKQQLHRPTASQIYSHNSSPFLLRLNFPSNCWLWYWKLKKKKKGKMEQTCFLRSLQICCSTMVISLSTRSIFWMSSSLENRAGTRSKSGSICTGLTGEIGSSFPMALPRSCKWHSGRIFRKKEITHSKTIVVSYSESKIWSPIWTSFKPSQWSTAWCFLLHCKFYCQEI